MELRKELAAKAFLRTASYDALIAEWLSDGKYHGVMLTEGKKLRYGENPHQWGKAFTTMDNGQWTMDKGKPGVANADVLQGKEMSYLNYLDADAAWQCVLEFEDPTVVFLKHASPCGVASNENILHAFRRGYDSDPRSAFGVIIALNRECPGSVVQEIIDRNIFTEILLAPSFTQEAIRLLREKPNIRVLKVSGTLEKVPDAFFPELRSISGGVLVQSWDRSSVGRNNLKIVTKVKPSEDQLQDLLFAWKVVKHVKSNAIVFAKDGVTVGIGPGQTSRVDATEIASRKAGAKAKGAVMASDAFFPFPDSVEEAAKHGITAIIQPGGSIRDQEVFAKADGLGIAMVLTGIRAFRH
jgi:phosphoribosylaminoimidazolecarboxamide formyltransferase/IMP cyclohydrolase